MTAVRRGVQAPWGTDFAVPALVIVGKPLPPPPDEIVNVRSTYGTSVIWFEKTWTRRLGISLLLVGVGANGWDCSHEGFSARKVVFASTNLAGMRLLWRLPIGRGEENDQDEGQPATRMTL